jgi:alkanesulfonate monooxygenase SsuD/methylene tetrahydromethanopterin reductase-like flavin-dependent oxidoreductase (luciferase family)
MFFSPREQAVYQKSLDEGFGRPGARHTPDTFEVAATVPVIIHDDVEQAADMMRPVLALYVGGMGARGRNFHFDVFARMGYEAEATRIQDLYLDGKKDEAAAAVPTSMVEDVYLVGPKEKIRDDLEAWKESIVTTMLVAGDENLLRTMASLVLD